MSSTRDHDAMLYMARFMLVGTGLVECSFREIGPSCLLFGHGSPEVTVALTANSWFEGRFLTESRCTEEHEIHGKFWGEHNCAYCPQFRRRAEGYVGWRVSDVLLEQDNLVIVFDRKLRLYIEAEEGDPSAGGWSVGTNMPLLIGQDNSGRLFGSIVDEVHTVFTEWPWTKDY